MAAPGAPTVLWLHGSSCTGCSVSLLNRISDQTGEPATDVSLDGSTAWLAAGGTWLAADVSTPSSPVTLASHAGQNTRVLAADQTFFMITVE